MNGIFKFFRESMVARFLIPVGLILIIVSVFAFISVNNIQNYTKTEAIVSKMELYEEAYTDSEGDHHESTYTVYVKYTVDEVEYETEYGQFSGYKIGDKVKICYNPKNPEDISQQNNYVLPIVILVAGIASTVGGIISIVIAVKKHKKMKDQEKEWVNGN